MMDCSHPELLNKVLDKLVHCLLTLHRATEAEDLIYNINRVSRVERGGVV